MSTAGPSRLPAFVAPSLSQIRAARPPIPRDLAKTLSRIRSDIFLTLHNPDAARLGTKYLRRPLRGPAMLKYYPLPQLPKLQNLNKFTPTNEYANWQGVNSALLPTETNSEGQVIPWASDKAPYNPDVWPEEMQGEFDTRGFEPVPGMHFPQQDVPVVQDGVMRIDKGDKFMIHPMEPKRQARVARKRKQGKGPPKKGGGRQQQVKK